MNIISLPWIAVDLGADRIHVAFQDAGGTVRSVQPENGEFDSVFHVSRNSEIRCGREAANQLAEDPEGIVLLSSFPLKTNEIIRFPDGRPPTKPSILFSVLLNRVRRYCEDRLFSGRRLETCVLTLPHRSSVLRRTYGRIAWDAGFAELHFRDSAIASETVRRHTWGDVFPFVTICNLGATQITFTLLKCRNGGSEHVDQFHSVGTFGVDEIDRIILQSADPGHIAPTDSFDALLQLKSLRRVCSFETQELYHFHLNGRKKRVRTVHFETATRIFLQKIQAAFNVYSERALEITGTAGTPIVLVGGGANNPLISQAIEHAAQGKIYWWAEAEEAAVLGTAMAFLPKTKSPLPTPEEERFYRLYIDAASGDDEARCSLAQMLESGVGTPVSLDEAFDWYRLAASRGSQQGKFGLARCLFQGLGTLQDTDAAVQLLEESAKAGYAPSQFSLAMFFFGNKPQSQDDAESWLQQAVEQGYAEALAYVERRARHPESIHAASIPGDWNMPVEIVVDEDD